MRDDYKLHREKRYVEVDVRFTPDGKIRLLPSTTTKAISTGLIAFWLSGMAHRALAGRADASPA